MKNTVCLTLCVVSIVTEPISARTGVNTSQLSSKIIGGEDSSEAEALYTASLQVNEVHICCGGMFKPGFLLSSGQCVAEIEKKLRNTSRHGSAVLGNKYLEEGKRCDILGLKLHPYFDILKKIETIWNFDVGVVMVTVPDYMMSLHFPPLLSFKPNLRKNLNGTLCGWGDTEPDLSHARIGTTGYSKILQCILLKVHGTDFCHRLTEDIIINFKDIHMCGIAHRTQKITLGDIGSPVIMTSYKDADSDTYIIGVATDQFDHNDIRFVRLLRINPVYQIILTMVKDLTSEAAANNGRDCQQDLTDAPYKRQKRITET